MTDTIFVRDVLPGDLPEWLVLWDAYNAFYGRSGSTALPREITEETWRRFFRDDEPVFALVAQWHGRMVGIAHYLFHHTTTSIATSCYLNDLYTDEQVRRKGVGRSLIEEVYSRALEFGAHRVYWQTHETNDTAARLYEQVATRSHFVIYGHKINGDSDD